MRAIESKRFAHERVADRMKELGLNDRAAAKSLDVSEFTVRFWRLGQRVPNSRYLPALARVLKINSHLAMAFFFNDFDSHQEEEE